MSVENTELGFSLRSDVDFSAVAQDLAYGLLPGDMLNDAFAADHDDAPHATIMSNYMLAFESEDSATKKVSVGDLSSFAINALMIAQGQAIDTRQLAKLSDNSFKGKMSREISNFAGRLNEAAGEEVIAREDLPLNLPASFYMKGLILVDRRQDKDKPQPRENAIALARTAIWMSTKSGRTSSWATSARPGFRLAKPKVTEHQEMVEQQPTLTPTPHRPEAEPFWHPPAPKPRPAFVRTTDRPPVNLDRLRRPDREGYSPKPEQSHVVDDAGQEGHSKRLSTDWRHQAACRDEDPELFFPLGDSGSSQLQIAEAKTVCRRCPVAVQCLEWALEGGEEFGVFGGTSEEERRELSRRSIAARKKTT